LQWQSAAPDAPRRPCERTRRSADRRQRAGAERGDIARPRQRRAGAGAARRFAGAPQGARGLRDIGMEPALEARLDELVRRRNELSHSLSGGALTGGDFVKFSKEYSELSPIVEGIEALRRAQSELAAAEEMAKADADPELKA